MDFVLDMTFTNSYRYPEDFLTEVSRDEDPLAGGFLVLRPALAGRSAFGGRLFSILLRMDAQVVP
jgi:hypothetical protein